MKKETYKTWCPLFPGFYGTVFEYDGEDQDIESYNEENKTDLNFDDFTFDYSDYRNRVANVFVGRCESELKQFIDIVMEFEKIDSPREYNFSNDTIDVSVLVNVSKLIKLIRERKEQAKEYFKSTYTSCSGFISFHSNDIEVWLNKDYILENPEHRVGALLDCLLKIEIDQDDIIYWTDTENYIDYRINEQ